MFVSLLGHFVDIETVRFGNVIPAKAVVDVLGCALGRRHYNREDIVALDRCAGIFGHLEPLLFPGVFKNRCLQRRVITNGIFYPFNTLNINVALLERGGDGDLADILVGDAFVEHCKDRSLKVVELLDNRRYSDGDLHRTHIIALTVELQHSEKYVTGDGTVDIGIVSQREVHRRDGTYSATDDSVRQITALVGDMGVT